MATKIRSSVDQNRSISDSHCSKDAMWAQVGRFAATTPAPMADSISDTEAANGKHQVVFFMGTSLVVRGPSKKTEENTKRLKRWPMRQTIAAGIEPVTQAALPAHLSLLFNYSSRMAVCRVSRLAAVWQVFLFMPSNWIVLSGFPHWASS